MRMLTDRLFVLKKRKTNDAAFLYRLTAVVSHKGINARSGHYEADVWTMTAPSTPNAEAEDDVPGEWHTFSDEMETNTNEESVVKCRARSCTALLFTRMLRHLIFCVSE